MAHNLTQQNLQRQQRRINKDKRTQRAQYLAEHRQELIALLDAQRQERGATFLVNALTAFMNSHGGSLFRDEGGGLYLSMMDGNEIVVAKDPIQVHEDPDMDVVSTAESIGEPRAVHPENHAIAIEELQQRINDNVLGHELLNGPLVDEMDDAEYIVKLQRVTGVLDEFITERTAFVEQSSYVMDLYNFKVLLQSGVRRMKLSLNQIRIRHLPLLQKGRFNRLTSCAQRVFECVNTALLVPFVATEVVPLHRFVQNRVTVSAFQTPEIRLLVDEVEQMNQQEIVDMINTIHENTRWFFQ